MFFLVCCVVLCVFVFALCVLCVFVVVFVFVVCFVLFCVLLLLFVCLFVCCVFFVVIAVAVAIAVVVIAADAVAIAVAGAEWYTSFQRGNAVSNHSALINLPRFIILGPKLRIQIRTKKSRNRRAVSLTARSIKCMHHCPLQLLSIVDVAKERLIQACHGTSLKGPM